MKSRLMHVSVLTALVLSIAVAAAAQDIPAITTIFIVRHAEKLETDSKDPSLTEAGKLRAQALLHTLKDTNISAIFCSQYERTRQTVQPLATALGLEIQQVDARDTRALVNRVLTDFREQTVVICGHSNTVPGIIEEFGGERVKQMSERDYDNLYVILRHRSGATRTMLLNYGKPDGTP